MYQSVCKDVFNGGRSKAIESLKEFKFNNELRDFWTSVINLGTDLAWMLVALAKRADGETELDETIDANWKLIITQWEKYDFAAEKIVDKHHDYFFHEDSILMGARYFIERCINNKDTNSPWQPYGFTVFMSMLVLTSLDFHIWMMDDADENFANIKDVYPDMVDAVNNTVAEEYEALTEMRRNLAQKMEVVSSKEISYADFYKADTNIKDFRNKLGAFISLEILKRESIGNITQLLRALSGIVGVAERKTGNNPPASLASDIEEIQFDD